MATIQKRVGKTGTTYRVIVRIKGHELLTESFQRRTDAVRWAEAEEARLRQSRSPAASRRYTLGDAIDRYLADELGALAASEKVHRESKLDWWRQRIGEVELRQISRDLPRRLLARLADGADSPTGRPLTFATCNRYKAALSAVLSAAIDWEWLESNPLHSSSRRRRPNSQRERERNREVTAEEFQRVLTLYRQCEDERLYTLALFARASGAREGELMRLRWEDADVDALPPRVEVHNTKSGGESRMLYFPGAAGEELRRMALRPHHRSGYLFGEPGSLHRDGPPRFPRDAFRYWTARSGVLDFWFHDLRHAWACHLLDEGVGLAQLMILGGWKSVAMVRRYAQRAQRQGNQALEAVGRSLLAMPDPVLSPGPHRLRPAGEAAEAPRPRAVRGRARRS